MTPLTENTQVAVRRDGGGDGGCGGEVGESGEKDAEEGYRRRWQLLFKMNVKQSEVMSITCLFEKGDSIWPVHVSLLI